MAEVKSNTESRERGIAVTEVSVDSFSRPDVSYNVRLYFEESGKIVGGHCNCPAIVAPYSDKHVRYVVAESYGENAPKVGSFVTPTDLDYLAELSGIAYFELSSAFTGERKIVAKAVVAAALTFGKEPEEWGRYVRSWSKRFERGKRHRAYVDCPEGAA